jgi:hypothetical protein
MYLRTFTSILLLYKIYFYYHNRYILPAKNGVAGRVAQLYGPSR